MSITVTDVAARDGLQSEAVTLHPKVRAELVDRLVVAGAKRLEVASFVSPRIVPQMALPEDVARRIRPASGVMFAGLVLNEQGYERLRSTRLNAVHVVVPCTDEFAFHNQRTDVRSAIAMAERIIERAHRDGRHVSVTLAVAFGCPYSGSVDTERVRAIAEHFGDADDLIIADTIGVATPEEARALVREVIPMGLPVGVHVHDTANMAVSNATAAFEAGATIFDGAVGGIGGCPFGPGSQGNVATEDIVDAFDRMGLETGLSLGQLRRVTLWLGRVLRRSLSNAVISSSG